MLIFKASVYAEKPQKDIHSFIGKMSVLDADTTEESLGIENTIWCGAVVASAVATGITKPTLLLANYFLLKPLKIKLQFYIKFLFLLFPLLCI